MIVVDDGSTDDTGRLVEEYGSAHGNLTLIRHLVNRNLGAARNTGLAAAKGDCIAFVDSDDEVEPGMVSALRMMEEKGLDMVAMRVEKVKEDGTVTEELTLPYGPEEVFSGVRLQEEKAYWCSAVWGYLYSKALIDRVRYPFVEGVFFEDVDFLCSHLYHADQISYCDDYGYRVYENAVSITHSFSPRHVFGYAYLGARMLSLYENLKDKTSSFAKSIQEGGSFNLWKAFRRLPRLGSVSDVKMFYNLLNSCVNCKRLWKSIRPARYRSFWTWLCLRHRQVASIVSESLVFLKESF